jgi:hypothetical protein
MRCIEFLCIFFRSSEFRNRNSDFSIFDSGIRLKIFRLESSESEKDPEFRFRWGSQKSEPKIGIPNLAMRLHYVLKPVLSEKKLQGGGTILRYDFMAGAQIVPKNRSLDRKEKKEECVLCARADNSDVREENLGRGGGDCCGGGDGDGGCGRGR